MPKKISFTSVASCLLAAAILLALGGQAQARSIPVDIRVATSDGQTLADHRQYTRPIAVRTSPRADCFGEGTGGSGDPVRVDGATALGVIAQAARHARSLRPLLITDHDFGFPGLGNCGIAGPTPSGEFWFLKTDHENPQTAADLAEVGPRGSVLWFLMPHSGCDPDPPFACSPELSLRAPARARPGQEIPVRVIAHDDAGKPMPVEGARVTGASEPTGASGLTRVSLPRSARLRAAKAGMIHSAAEAVCVSERLRRCPPARGMRILGSDGSDRIGGTPGPDAIRTGPGSNRVNVRGGWRDRVLCGRGDNVVIADRHDLVRGCRTVLRR